MFFLQKIVTLSLYSVIFMLSGCNASDTSTEDQYFLSVKQQIEEGVSVNDFDEKGHTPLISATLNNNLETVSYLISKGADVNLKNEAGYTALHKASYKGYDKIVENLIINGAKVDAENFEKSTPLLLSVNFYIAGNYDNIKSIKILLDNGANPELKDSLGESTMTYIYMLNNMNPDLLTNKSLIEIFEKWLYSGLAGNINTESIEDKTCSNREYYESYVWGYEEQENPTMNPEFLSAKGKDIKIKFACDVYTKSENKTFINMNYCASGWNDSYSGKNKRSCLDVLDTI